MAGDADIIVVGGGLAGLVAATEIAHAGKRVIVVDQEGEQSLGGQAFWSFGGLFLVDSGNSGGSASRTVTISPCRTGSGRPASTATRICGRGAGRKPMWRSRQAKNAPWLRAMGLRSSRRRLAERGGYDAMGHGNSVPRFHVTWGTGPGVVEPFERRARKAQASGRLTFRFRHRVDALTMTNGTVDGVSGSILEPDHVERGKSSSRKVMGDFTLHARP